MAKRPELESSPSSGSRALQARVGPELARKFDAVARARNMTDSQLVRYSIELMLSEATRDLDALQESVLRSIAEAKKTLNESPQRRK